MLASYTACSACSVGDLAAPWGSPMVRGDRFSSRGYSAACDLCMRKCGTLCTRQGLQVHGKHPFAPGTATLNNKLKRP